jgi:hypothetical protein
MNPLRKIAVGGALLAATLTGVAVGATLLGTASAQTGTTAPTTDAPATDAPAPSSGARHGPGGGAPSGPHQANGKTETVLTGDELAKVTAGVQAKEPGATIDRAETDADGDVYEAHITKADGTKATVKFDASFTVTNVVNGMG